MELEVWFCTGIRECVACVRQVSVKQFANDMLEVLFKLLIVTCSVTNPVCRYVLFNCQLGITMTRYTTRFLNCNRAIPLTLLLLLFLSISCHSVSLARSTFPWVEKLEKWKIRYVKALHRMDSEDYAFSSLKTNPLYPFFTSKAGFPQEYSISNYNFPDEKNNPHCHTMFRSNRDTLWSTSLREWSGFYTGRNSFRDTGAFWNTNLQFPDIQQPFDARSRTQDDGLTQVTEPKAERHPWQRWVF